MAKSPAGVKKSLVNPTRNINFIPLAFILASTEENGPVLFKLFDDQRSLA